MYSIFQIENYETIYALGKYKLKFPFLPQIIIQSNFYKLLPKIKRHDHFAVPNNFSSLLYFNSSNF